MAPLACATLCAASRPSSPNAWPDTTRTARSRLRSASATLRSRVRRDPRALGNRQRFGNPAAVAPRRVGGQDQGGNPAGRGHRRLHRGGPIDTDAIRRFAAPHPVRHGPGEPLGVVGERRVVGSVPGRVVADDVHHRGVGAPRVVDVGGAVREPGSAMEQRRGRPSRHARVTVGASGHHRLREAEHATHAGDLVERRDEVHLRRAGVGEAGIDAAREQRANQAFGSIHANETPRAPDRPRTLAHASGSGRNGPGPGIGRARALLQRVRTNFWNDCGVKGAKRSIAPDALTTSPT